MRKLNTEYWIILLGLILIYIINLVYLSFQMSVFQWSIHRSDGWYLLMEFLLPNILVNSVIIIILFVTRCFYLGVYKIIYLAIITYLCVVLNNPKLQLFIFNMVMIICMILFYLIKSKSKTKNG